MKTTALSLLLLASCQRAHGQYYAPGDAAWLGHSGIDPTPDYKPFLPIIYVIYGPEGSPHVRAIIDENHPDCPIPMHMHNTTELLATHKKMNALFNGNPVDENKMPYKFPVKVCGITLEEDSDFREFINEGALVLSHNNQTYEVPRALSNPKRFLLIGDTGLRLKPSNLGLGDLGKDNSPNNGANCTAPEIYGIQQCYTNFTKTDLIQNQTGDFQGLDEWYFKDIADSASKQDIDVVVYVGDYLYRQGPCPLNNTQGKDCSGVNLPSFVNEPTEDGTVLNFIPGIYGDNWWGWWADFFYPAMNLLKSAPVIPTRGNHEICTRGGYGYFLFMSPTPLEDYCLDNFPPYSVKFEHEQFIVMDDSIIDPLYGGVDHYEKGQCPGIPASGTIVPIQEDRHNDTSDTKIQPQLDMFTEQFKLVDKFTQDYDTNFYVGHRPILGIGCNDSQVVTLDWTLQQSLGPNTLDRINGIITGHMHWLEVLQFQENKLPSQIVVGNGGTKLINNYINQSSIPYIDLHVGKPEYGIQGRVERGLTKSAFGYGIMERKSGEEGYLVNFYTWNTDTASMEALDFALTIPKGLRNAAEPTSEPTAVPTPDPTADVQSGIGGEGEENSTASSTIYNGLLLVALIGASLFGVLI